MAHFPLTYSVNAAETLLYAIGIPRQVIVDHQMRTLKIHALARGVCSEQHHSVGIMGETFAGDLPIFAAGASVDRHNGIGPPKLSGDLACQIIEGVAVLGENYDLACLVGTAAGEKLLVKNCPQLHPFAVLSLLAHTPRRQNEVVENGDLRSKLGYRLGRRRQIDDFIHFPFEPRALAFQRILVQTLEVHVIQAPRTIDVTEVLSP